MSKKLKYWILHCAATKPYMNIGADFIHQVHIEENGWDRYGYESIIRRDGSRDILTPFDDDGIVQNHEMTWGAKGINSVSIHTCLAGGLNNKGGAYSENSDFCEPYTLAQFVVLQNLAHEMIKMFPWVKIAGHYDFSKKSCPGFDVQTFLRNIRVPEDNIFKSI